MGLENKKYQKSFFPFHHKVMYYGNIEFYLSVITKMRLKDRSERILGSGQRNLKIEKSGGLVKV